MKTGIPGLGFSLGAALLLIPCPSAATEWFPEFGSLTEAEEVAFEGPSRLTSEYSSHTLVYSTPLSWQGTWLSNRNGFQTSVGSTGAKHFIIDTRARFRAVLSENFEFRFTHFQDRNHEKDAVHSILEVIIRPVKWAGLSLYAEPSLYKRQNDTGLALVVNPEENHEIRLFNTFVDVTRLRRNDRNDTYVVGYEPIASGLVGRLWKEASPIDENSPSTDFLEYAIRYESRTRWLFPDQQYEYQYWKMFGSLFASRAVNDRLRLSARFVADRKFESKAATGTSSVISRDEAWVTDRLFLRFEAERSRLGPGEKWSLRPGLMLAVRHWKTTRGAVLFRDVLPYVWLRLPTWGKGDRQDMFEIGYDATWHRQFEDAYPRTSADGIRNGLEHRINLSYEFSFGRHSKLRIIATGDLDKMFTRQSWEGGNLQFMTAF